MNENELRTLLKERARDFEMDASIPAPLARTARRRIIGRLATASVAAAMVALAGAGLALEWRPADERAARGETVLVYIDLADYYESEGGKSEDHPPRSVVDQHIECMREQGFDLPDPQRTEDGWAILVDDPERYDMESARWREAAHVTCAPQAPGPGDLFLPGFAQARIDTFRDCMSSQGFQLPEPSQTDTGGWRFDTSSGGFDFNDVSWKRALFVTCSVEPAIEP